MNALPLTTVALNTSYISTQSYIPQALAKRRRWISWKPGEVDPKTGKYDKIPTNANGYVIDNNKASNWQYLTAFTLHERLGFALGDGISGIDLDYCRNPQTGAIDRWATDIIAQVASYSEVSPSGTGVKIWVFGDAGTFTARVEGNGTIEVYHEKRFFTFTGQHLDGTPNEVQLAQRALDALRERFAPKACITTLPTETRQQVTSDEGKSTHERIARFNADNSLPDLLVHYGCKHTSGRGDTRYFSGFPGDSHSHTNTLKVKRDGRGWRGWSMSPNCCMGNDKRGFDSFDVYCQREHNGDVHDALKALKPAATRPKAEVPPMPADEGPTEEQRRSWREAKAAQRAAEKAHMLAVRDAVLLRANADELSGIAMVALLALLEIAGIKDWCKPSMARIASLIGCSEGHARRGLAELESRYITTERNVNPVTGELWSGGRHGETPIRRFIDFTEDTKKTQPESDVCSIVTAQTDKTGRTSKNVNVCHNIYINISNYGNDSSCKGGQEQPAAPAPVVEKCEPDEQPEAIAFAGGASFDPSAALPLADKPYSERCKANLSPDEINDGLRALLADWQTAHPQTDDEADIPDAEQISLLDDPQPVVPAEPTSRRQHTMRPQRAQRQRRTLFDLPTALPMVAIVATSCPPLEEKPEAIAQTSHPDMAAMLPQEECGAAWRMGYSFMTGFEGIEERAHGESPLARWRREYAMRDGGDAHCDETTNSLSRSRTPAIYSTIT